MRRLLRAWFALGYIPTHKEPQNFRDKCNDQIYRMSKSHH